MFLTDSLNFLFEFYYHVYQKKKFLYFTKYFDKLYSVYLSCVLMILIDNELIIYNHETLTYQTR
jgi:hypothetical protein